MMMTKRQLPRTEPRYLTVQQAAVHSALSESTLRRAIRRGDLTACKPCRGRILIAQVDLETWLRATVIGTHKVDVCES